MKKIYSSILIGMCTLTLSAQLTQANHAPAAGDSRQMYRCDSVSPGTSGAGQLWDFSGITTHSNIVLNYYTIVGTYTDFPGATIAAITGTDAAYYDSDANSLKFYGSVFSVGSGFTAVKGGLVYANPAINAAYPMSFNTSSTSAISGSIAITAPISTSGTFTGTSMTKADGTGTIVLPGAGNTFNNVLRVVTSQTVDFTTSVSDGQVLLDEYNYYVDGYKFPFMTISIASASTGLGTTTQTIVTRDKTPGLTGIPVNAALAQEKNWSVYPNPANSFVNVVGASSETAKVFIFDITGKLILEKLVSDGNGKIELGELSQGLYLYQIQNSESQILKSGKLTVTH